MPKRGAAHHNASLSDADVAEIRKLREAKPWLWSYRSLAEHYGCGVSTARDIVKHETRNKVAA